jgi:hypothetical protein
MISHNEHLPPQEIIAGVTNFMEILSRDLKQRTQRVAVSFEVDGGARTFNYENGTWFEDDGFKVTWFANDSNALRDWLIKLFMEGYDDLTIFIGITREQAEQKPDDDSDPASDLVSADYRLISDDFGLWVAIALDLQSPFARARRPPDS